MSQEGTKRAPRVARFAMAYAASIITPDRLFVSPCFAPSHIKQVKTIFVPEANYYLSMLTLCRATTRAVFLRCIDCFRATVNPAFACQGFAQFQGGVVAGVSEVQQTDPLLVSEGVAFANICFQFEQQPSNVLTLLSDACNKKKRAKRLDNRARFTTFFLYYQRPTPQRNIFQQVSFHALRIKSVQTVQDKNGVYLSYILLHGRRSQALVQRSIDEYNYWCIDDPIDIHLLITPQQRQLMASFKKRLLSAGHNTHA